MTDELSNYHRCRTCEHWGAPYAPVEMPELVWDCACPIPQWARQAVTTATSANDGEKCAAYSYSLRRARLVKEQLPLDLPCPSCDGSSTD